MISIIVVAQTWCLEIIKKTRLQFTSDLMQHNVLKVNIESVMLNQ